MEKVFTLEARKQRSRVLPIVLEKEITAEKKRENLPVDRLCFGFHLLSDFSKGMFHGWSVYSVYENSTAEIQNSLLFLWTFVGKVCCARLLSLSC